MTDKSAAKKAPAKKATAEKKTDETPDETSAADEQSVKNNTLAHPIDRSILVGPTTGDLNPAFEVEHD